MTKSHRTGSVAIVVIVLILLIAIAGAAYYVFFLRSTTPPVQDGGVSGGLSSQANTPGSSGTYSGSVPDPCSILSASDIQGIMNDPNWSLVGSAATTNGGDLNDLSCGYHHKGSLNPIPSEIVLVIANNASLEYEGMTSAEPGGTDISGLGSKAYLFIITIPGGSDATIVFISSNGKYFTSVDADYTDSNKSAVIQQLTAIGKLLDSRLNQY